MQKYKLDTVSFLNGCSVWDGTQLIVLSNLDSRRREMVSMNDL